MSLYTYKQATGSIDSSQHSAIAAAKTRGLATAVANADTVLDRELI
jgi:hypothetical protein